MSDEPANDNVVNPRVSEVESDADIANTTDYG